MLSFIYRSAEKFCRQHGTRPNIIYMSHKHFEQLRREHSASLDIAVLPRLLGMEIILGYGYTHPQVAWSQYHPGYSMAG